MPLMGSAEDSFLDTAKEGINEPEDRARNYPNWNMK